MDDLTVKALTRAEANPARNLQELLKDHPGSLAAHSPLM